MPLRNAMKVLITGGAGYIGSILSEQLLARGDKVHVVDSLVHGDHCLFQLCANPDFEFTRGDVRDREMVLRAAKDADVKPPRAALGGPPLCQKTPGAAKAINYEAVVELAKLRSP